MKYGNTNLTQRSGYPQQRSGQQQPRSTFLDLPTGEETEGAASYTSPPGKKHPGPRRRGAARGGDEPWLVRKIRAWSEASFYTKASYFWVWISLLVAWLGFRSLRHGHASVWLTCHSSSCDLEISPPGRTKMRSIHILREQLVRADVVKVDKDGNIMEVVDSVGSAPADLEMGYRKGSGKKGRGGGSKYKGRSKEYTGPDENGWYDSYALVLNEEVGGGGGGADDASRLNEEKRRDERQRTDGEKKDDEEEEDTTKKKERKETKDDEGEAPPSKEKNSLSALIEFITPDSNGEFVFPMRRYNTGQSRRHALTAATRINSYIRNRRHKLAVRESRNVAWQGIMGVVLGIFSLILSVLVGQFWEPEERHKMSGPGVRRKNPPPNAPGRRAPPAAAGLYGRPGGGTSAAAATSGRKKTAATGYGSYGGYRPSAPQKRAY